ncbi:MAG TPA: alpha/beta hydrolase [Acidimicrobiales bacterium]|jgi:pimeloyl-ACP methyl ester carboxylesterase|nr:alpha/beta hydrolase [Acidimicrobiales bacterium]
MGVVLVHGAWHGSWCWDGVVAALDRRGILSTAVELPFTGFDDDVEAVRQGVLAMGPDAVVVAHSYSGFVVSNAARGRSDVRRLVYVASFMTDEDEDAPTIMTNYNSQLPDAVAIEGDQQVAIDPARARELFYGDLDEASAALLTARLRPISFASALGRQGPPAWKSIPSTYVICTNDSAIPVAAQRWMAQRANVVHELPTDHSPFNTRPEDLADIISQAG